MIIATGANGQLGRAVLQGLVARLPAATIGVSVREPEKAAWLAERGVRVRQGTFEDPASLRHAFEGASVVLIISSSTGGDATPQLHQHAVEAAKAAGAQRILYTSHMGANGSSAFPPMRNHAATEAILAAAGLPFTALRNGFYAASAIQLLGNAVETGRLAVPQDGPVAWTAHADLAALAVHALTGATAFEGPTPPLTGSEALDLAAVAAIASDLTGRRIERVVVSDEEFRAQLTAQGVPEYRVGLTMGLFEASRNNEFTAVDPTLANQIARKPLTMRQALEAHLAAQ